MCDNINSGGSKSTKKNIKKKPKETLEKKQKLKQCPGSNPEAKKRKIQEESDEKPTKKQKIQENRNVDDDCSPDWEAHELLAIQHNLKNNIAKNIITLFEDGNTIPFIARYRRDATENMTPEMLREVKESFEDICNLKSKINTTIKSINKSGLLNPHLLKTIKSVQSIEELEIIYAPFKPGGKRTLAERAKELGLENPAMSILNNIKVDLNDYIVPDKKELSKMEDVEKGVIHIIAYAIATDSELLSYLRHLRAEVNFILETKKSQSKQESKSKPSDKKGTKGKPIDESKYENYFDYKIPVKYIKPHQVLAINRGEQNKILSVKIVVPDYLFNKFFKFCCDKWMRIGNFDVNRKRILEEAIKDSYNRLVQPLIIREIRAELRAKAEKASCDVFSTNLKQLLLIAPIRGKPILAIDPGYSNGCKLAIVSSTGSFLSSTIIYLHKSKGKTENAEILKNMLEEYNCSLIALGNGTACRETEEWLTKLIQEKVFYPRDVTYTIVSEDGASIYSCSPEAKKEFPDLDTNIVSAVSLARRIQDPLAELVKVEPQHLGVGMYQHDLKKKQLEEALNEVVSECVSFVGVDLNTASQCLLRRIAGLSDKRAAQIIKHREKNGPFLYRKQLTDVSGIGVRIFEQSAGFLRVGPTDAKEAVGFYKKPKTTKLDCTYIHPESYDVANTIINKLNLKPEDIGEPSFIDKVKSNQFDIAGLSKELGASEETIKLIFEALGKPLNYDLRCEISQIPLFKKGLTSIYDIGVGTIVTGRVKNVTHFGCFVDIGVGTDGLIHNSKLNGCNLQLGDRTEAKVINIDISKKRIGLEAVRKL